MQNCVNLVTNTGREFETQVSLQEQISQAMSTFNDNLCESLFELPDINQEKDVLEATTVNQV